DAHQPKIHTEAQISVRNVELKRLFPKLESSKGSAGKFGGQGHLTAVGNSPAEMLGSMDGELALIMAGGYASTLILVLTNLDLARAAQLLIGGDKTSRIRCVVADFHIKHGKAIVRTLVADTSAVNIKGRGNVNFHDERYDLHIKADSKKPSPLALKGPIAIAGTFKHPDIKPVIGKEAARVGAAIVLGVLATPLAALLPLIDLGNAKNSDCSALIHNARQNVGKDKARH
ncbi:MAG TPA: AsmA-like C-terminal region-containing protein, partial [Burkholderiales bacterium]|nr:AsmA-like C-terminal region-containing protein [Burkholderiales bacterium]